MSGERKNPQIAARSLRHRFFFWRGWRSVKAPPERLFPCPNSLGAEICTALNFFRDICALTQAKRFRQLLHVFIITLEGSFTISMKDFMAAVLIFMFHSWIITALTNFCLLWFNKFTLSSKQPVFVDVNLSSLRFAQWPLLLEFFNFSSSSPASETQIRGKRGKTPRDDFRTQVGNLCDPQIKVDNWTDGPEINRPIRNQSAGKVFHVM